MKTDKELRKEVDKILGDKVSARVKEFQAQRDEDFKELMTLNQTLETIEGKKAGFLKEKGGLNTLIDKDLGRFNYLDGHVRWLDGQIKGYRDQIEKVVTKLTNIPEFDSKTLNFLSRLIDFK